jgi:hypothetical protein
MDLAPDDLRDLAAFCARRFPGAAERASLAAQAELDAPVAGEAITDWTTLLDDAQRHGRLTVLAKALAAAAPNDANLQAACAELTGAASRRRARNQGLSRLAAGGVALGAAAAGMTLAVAAGWWIKGREPSQATSPATPSPATSPASAVASASPEAPVVRTSAALATPPAPAAAPPAAPSSTTVAAPAAVAPPVTAATAPPASRVTGCDAHSGEVVGWWYAGTAAPGAVGGTVVLDRDARVRADYPRFENGHDARTPERCVLPRGSRLLLSHAPVNASGGHWWVPYSPGDRVN